MRDIHDWQSLKDPCQGNMPAAASSLRASFMMKFHPLLLRTQTVRLRVSGQFDFSRFQRSYKSRHMPVRPPWPRPGRPKWRFSLLKLIADSVTVLALGVTWSHGNVRHTWSASGCPSPKPGSSGHGDSQAESERQTEAALSPAWG